MAQHLQASDKRKIQRLYLSGVKSGEIARKLGRKPASIRQYLCREGLTRRRNEIEAVKERTAREILENVRKHSVGDFEAILELLGEGLKIDARKLRDGWDLVKDAAGASALMRAKSLNLDRTLRFHGVDQPDGSHMTSVPTLSMFIVHGEKLQREEKAVTAAEPIGGSPPAKS